MSARPIQLFVHSDPAARAPEESPPTAAGRISAEDAARLLSQLESGECTCLGPHSGSEVLRELLFLRRQVQKIRSLSESETTRSLAHKALYGARQ